MRYIIALLLLTSCASLPRERAKRNVLACTKDLMDYTKDLEQAFNACEKLEKDY